MDIRKNLKDVLALRGKSLGQMCLKLKLSKSSATNWFSGKRAISLDLLCEIADYCNCSVDYLLGRTDSPDPWKATAMDELKLTSQVVSVIRGESPQQHQMLNDLKKSNPNAIASIDHNIQMLDTRQDSIHHTVAALLQSSSFEAAMLKLECACRFETGVALSKKRRTKENTLRHDDEISDLGNGQYAVPLSDVSKYRKSAALDCLRRAIDDAIKIYTIKHVASAVLNPPKEDQ